MTLEKTVVFQVHRPRRIPHLKVSYKNKHELFRKYKEWIKGLNLPRNEVYWCDYTGDHMGIRNADDLLEAVHVNDENSFEITRIAKLFTPFGGDDLFFCSDSEEDEVPARGRSKEKKRTTNSRRTERTPSSSPPLSLPRRRSQSKSADRRHRSFSECRCELFYKEYFYYCVPFLRNFPMDPRFMPPQLSDVYRRDARAATSRCDAHEDV